MFFAEIGIDGGGFGKMLAGIMLGFLAEIVAGNRAVITHHPGPNFTSCSLLLAGIVLSFHLFLGLPADEAGLLLIIVSTCACAVLCRRNYSLHYTLFPYRKQGRNDTRLSSNRAWGKWKKSG